MNSTSKKKAIFTKIKNGGEFFKIWYRYYSKFFPDEHMYVLDFGSTDGSLDGLKCNIINFDPNIYQVGGRSAQINAQIVNWYKTVLLRDSGYEYVVYTDFDEIIFHPLGINNYIDQLDDHYVTCKGYELVQKRSEEGPIDFNTSILAQRNYWYPYNHYDKSLITKFDFTWQVGMHQAVDSAGEILPENFGDGLLLIHLHKIDYDFTYSLNYKNLEKLRVDHARNTLVGGGYHNFILNEEFDQCGKRLKNNLFLSRMKLKGV